MNEWEEFSDELLTMVIERTQAHIQDNKEKIADLQKSVDYFSGLIGSIQAEQARRALGFGVGDRLAPCAEFTETMMKQTKLYRALFMSGGYMTADEITGDSVLVRNDNGQAWVSFAVARAMRAEWLRRQEGQP